MANIKSQIKRNRTNEVGARRRNKAAKSEVKTRIKNAVASVAGAGRRLRRICG